MKHFYSLICFLIICAGGLAQSYDIKCQKIIDSVYTSNPSAVGILVHVESPKHKMSWSGATGHASKETQMPLNPYVPVLIASNIKTYVAATILQLVEENRLSIEQPITKLLTKQTRKLFIEGGYVLDSIRVKHLLSHTSGIENYANRDYISFINSNKNYRWTRDKQLELTIEVGPPLGMPGDGYKYSDANYLLLTEIIEHFTRDQFYTEMRKRLGYNALGLSDTWMPTLEDKPKATLPLAHQYWGKNGWDSYDIDVSVDLFGGGGIACTTSDLARFNYKLFNGEIVKDTAVLNLIYTKVPTIETATNSYHLGIFSNEYLGYKSYGHGGFWGTTVAFFPSLDLCISVFILEKDDARLRKDIIELMLKTMAD